MLLRSPNNCKPSICSRFTLVKKPLQRALHISLRRTWDPFTPTPPLRTFRSSLPTTSRRQHFSSQSQHETALREPSKESEKGVPETVSSNPPLDTSAKPLAEEEFLKIVEQIPIPEGPVGVAVSGTPESLALALLCRKWAQKHKRRFLTVSVDHAFRVGTDREMQWTHETLTSLGIHNEVLQVTWKEEEIKAKKRIGLARDKRLRLLAQWASNNSIQTIFMGQPVETQMESFTVRFMRGSGLDGLACLEAFGSYLQYFNIARPFISISRQRLIATCNAEGIGYLVNSVNENLDSMRIKVENYLSTVPQIHNEIREIITHCDNTRVEFKRLVDYFLQKYAMVSNVGGFVFLRLHELKSMPLPLAERLFLRILPIISGRDKSPASVRLHEVLQRLKNFQFNEDSEYSQEGRDWTQMNNVAWFAEQRNAELRSGSEGSSRFGQDYNRNHYDRRYGNPSAGRGGRTWKKEGQDLETLPFINPFQTTLGGCLMRYVKYRGIECIMVQAEKASPPFETVLLSLNETKIWEGRFLISLKSRLQNPRATQQFYCRRLSYEEWPLITRNRALFNKLRFRTSSLDLIMVQPAFFTLEDKFVALPFLDINLLPGLIFEATFYPVRPFPAGETVADV